MWISWRAAREGIKEAVTPSYHLPSRWSGSYLVAQAPLPPLQSMVGSGPDTESLSSLLNNNVPCRLDRGQILPAWWVPGMLSQRHSAIRPGDWDRRQHLDALQVL